jgi:hypothetical protein
MITWSNDVVLARLTQVILHWSCGARYALLGAAALARDAAAAKDECGGGGGGPEPRTQAVAPGRYARLIYIAPSYLAYM